MSCLSDHQGARLRPAPHGGSSPTHVQVSTAAAITIGAIPGRLHRCGGTPCLNLLLTYPEGCRANCAYCGLARHRDEAYAERNFIRVDWPTLALDALIDAVAARPASFERMCISMITHPRAEADTLTILKAWRARLAIPVSILSNPTTMTRADIQSLHDEGADIFTVALDAATEPLFTETRGKPLASPHRWDKYWDAFHQAHAIFGPGRIGMHLIAGLGETDRDLLTICRDLHAWGGHSHLFCFFPERGSLLADRPPTPRPRWRRLQLARYLIEYAGHPFDALRFDASGALTDLGLPPEALAPIIADGTPFRTSGCPGAERPDLSACTRPYGDSPPSDIASFPYAPHADDQARIRAQLGLP